MEKEEGGEGSSSSSSSSSSDAPDGKNKKKYPHSSSSTTTTTHNNIKRTAVEADLEDIPPPKDISKRPRLNSTDDVIVYLKVSGKMVATFQSTLCKVKDSKLAEIFSQEEIPLTKDDSGCYIIDRPKKPFCVILNYLRTGKFYIPSTDEEKFILKEEIEFWGMKSVYEKEAGVYFEGTTLVDSSQQTMLNEWYGKRGQKWRMLYKASRDGWESTDFHNKANGNGPTLTIIQANGYLFGGYTPIEWNSRGGYAWDSSTWIFSLTNPTNCPIKMKNECPKGKHYKYSIYDHKDYGPTFGGGYDIGIQSGANKSNQNYSLLGYNFVPPGKTLGTEEAKNFLTGSFYFTVSEIEVYTPTIG